MTCQRFYDVGDGGIRRGEFSYCVFEGFAIALIFLEAFKPDLFEHFLGDWEVQITVEFKTFLGEHHSLKVNANGRDLVVVGARVGNDISEILCPKLNTMALEVDPRRLRFPHVDVEISVDDRRKLILL